MAARPLGLVIFDAVVLVCSMDRKKSEKAKPEKLFSVALQETLCMASRTNVWASSQEYSV